MSKVKIEKILIADGNSALVAGGTALIHPTTGVINLTDGQLGIFAGDGGTITKNTAIAAGTTKFDAPNIYIAQGNANSANPKVASSSPLPIRAYERSQIVKAGFVGPYTGRASAAGTNCTWLVGRKDGTGAEIVPLSDTYYKLTLAFSGRMVEYLNGRNSAAIYPEFTTRDFDDLGIATETNQRDYVVQNLVANANMESKVYPNNPSGAEVVALAISETGVGTGTAISGIAAGNITIGVDAEGNNIVVVFTSEMVTSLKKALTANGGPLDNTAEIVAYNTATAGNGSTTADVMAFIMLDRDLAYFDRIPQIKSRVNVGLEEGFSSLVYNAQVAAAYEGEGKGRHWKLYYESTDELRKFNTEQLPSAYVMQYTSEIDESDTYYVYTFDHALPDVTSGGEYTDMPHKTIVIIPSGDTTTLASFEAVLNPWMESCGLPAVNL